MYLTLLKEAYKYLIYFEYGLEILVKDYDAG